MKTLEMLYNFMDMDVQIYLQPYKEPKQPSRQTSLAKVLSNFISAIEVM